MFLNSTNSHRLAPNLANHSVVYYEPIIHEPIYHAPIVNSFNPTNKQVNFIRQDTPISNQTPNNTLHPNMFQPINILDTSKTSNDLNKKVSNTVQGSLQGYPNQVNMQGVAQGNLNQANMQGSLQGYPNQMGLQGTPQGYPNQMGLQGTPQGYPNQGGMQGAPQGYPNQGGIQGAPQGYPNQVGMQGTPQGYPNQGGMLGAPQGYPNQVGLQGAPQGAYQLGNYMNQSYIQPDATNAAYSNINNANLDQTKGTNPSVDPYFINPLQNQLNVTHPMYNPYPKMKILPKQQSSSTSLLSSFKGPDGKYDVTTVVNTAGQMVNVVNQVGSIVKGIGGIFKV